MSTKSISSLDDLRAAHPELGLALYMLEPHGVVTLEIVTPDGDLFSFKALTAAAAIEQAFPADKPTDTAPAATEPAGSIFD